MQTKVIEVSVSGAVGVGKTDVCRVIRQALVDAYGPHAQVASYELAVETASVNKFAAPDVAGTVFVIREQVDR